MGTTPMGTGNPHTTPAPCKKQCGGDPHDDDNYDPNPNGLPGSPECYPGELVCQLAAGGYQVGTGPSPDYFALNGCYGFVFGICAQIVRDYYNNWYWGVGPGLMSGSAYSLNAGWLLQSGRSEEAIQNFTLKWSAFVGGILPMPHPLAGAGAAVTWGDPSLTRPFDYHDLAGEAQVGNAGVTGGLIYDFWIFDSGDPTPWFWQDNDGINNINP